MTAERREFQAEVQQLLHLMIHSLYSNREIFLRELVSNASDAIDKLRFEAIEQPDLLGGDAELGIDLLVDKDAGTVTVRDNGIGMSEQEVIDNLGTIARSGTRRFLDAMSGDQKKDSQLIGQFGVGFYSAFIVAETVSVVTRRAGEDTATRWTSDGQGSYTIEATDKDARGTDVILKLREDQREFADPSRLRFIVSRYSEHIGVPIRMRGEDGEKLEAINEGRALWTRPRNEIKDEDYRSFYQQLAHDPEAPLCWSHNRVEGAQEYTSLLYLPARAPFDLWDRDQRRGLKLYVKRVFIMDEAEQLLPSYLRFVRGLVDSADLPLNVSRELLQDNRSIGRIRTALVKRTLDMIEQLVKERPEDFQRFWSAFGQVLKEGVVEDGDNRERIAALLRYPSTASEGDALVGLDEYIERMPEGQPKTIYYLTADKLATARRSPHLEGFRKQGYEVLLMADRVDEWVVGHLTEYKGCKLESAASAAAEPEADKENRERLEKEHGDLIARLKQALEGRVADVRVSTRLTDSPACLVFDDQGMSANLQRLLREAGQSVPDVKPLLELNTDHPLIDRMEQSREDARFDDYARLLFGQAVLAEGGQLDDPADFVRCLNQLVLGQAVGETEAD